MVRAQPQKALVGVGLCGVWVAAGWPRIHTLPSSPSGCECHPECVTDQPHRCDTWLHRSSISQMHEVDARPVPAALLPLVIRHWPPGGTTPPENQPSPESE